MKLLKTITVQLFTGANIATILLLWLCCGVTYLHPAPTSKAELLALAFPVFLAVNAAFVIFWLIFKAKRVWLPIVGLVACWSFVRDYIPVNFTSTPSAPSLTVLTFNTHGLAGYAADSVRTNAMCQYLLGCDADIICLQEVNNGGITAFKTAMAERGYCSAEGSQDIIFSRLPIRSSQTLTHPTLPTLGIKAWLTYDTDSLLLVNVHLASNHFSDEQKEAYRSSIRSLTQDSLRRGLMPLARLLMEAAPVRAAQADTLAAIIDSLEASQPVLVCGDFNDTPVSYTHRVLTRRLHSAYRQSGCGLGFTFHEHGFPVRIDHILYSPAVWTSSGTEADTDFSQSDHYPVITHLTKR